MNDYRNPFIAEAMKEMKYVNMFNRGIKRVQEMLHENGNGTAEFDVSKLTAFCVEVKISENVQLLQPKTGDTIGDIFGDTIGDILSERKKKIIQLIVENPHISISDLAASLGTSTRTIKRDITSLSKWVRHEGSPRAGEWVVTSPQKPGPNENKE